MSQPLPVAKTCVCHNPRVGCPSGAGQLFIWFPVPHALIKVIPFLKQAAFDYELMQARSGLRVTCKTGQVQEVAAKIAHLLAPRELGETRVLFLQGMAQPQLHDFSDITSLQHFVGRNESDWLVEMLTAERFTTYFQPIVSTQDTSQIYAYESLLRGLDADGNLVMPGLILEQATKANLLPQLDRVARLSAIAHASQHQLNSHIFINFMPTALYDPVSCLRSTVEAIDRAGIAHERIVFEVVETDTPQDLNHLKTVLKYYRDAGFLVALDDLGAGYSSLNLLHQLRPDFIKLDMALIRNVDQDPYKASITAKLLEIAQALGVPTIAEGIESIAELHWLQKHGATFAQGYLFAKPSAIPASETPRYPR
ncbi:EAL domain-containing protein [Cyanobacteria bacterium FACHB-DQ100]|nr:EAL domain-containing protein [Cyanobacteria bacterium FACHB-DQ100]